MSERYISIIALKFCVVVSDDGKRISPLDLIHQSEKRLFSLYYVGTTMSINASCLEMNSVHDWIWHSILTNSIRLYNLNEAK